MTDNSNSPQAYGIARQTKIQKAPGTICTGSLWAETLVDTGLEGENTVMRATFEPGVITSWHTHPRGQILYALFGSGRLQRKGEQVQEIRAGDCIRFDAGEMHWHGAAVGSAFIYISIQATQDGRTVAWSDPVVI